MPAPIWRLTSGLPAQHADCVCAIVVCPSRNHSFSPMTPGCDSPNPPAPVRVCRRTPVDDRMIDEVQRTRVEEELVFDGKLPRHFDGSAHETPPTANRQGQDVCSERR